MKMPKLTVIYGIILVLLGLAGYFATGMVSITALIPAFFGIVVVLLGVLACKESRRKMMMHIAVVVGLLGVAGTLGGLMKLPTYFSGGELARPEAVLAQGVMCILSLIYILLGIKSFIDARRAKPA